MARIGVKFVILLFLLNCKNEVSKKDLRIKAKDNQNNALVGATVKIDGKISGTTDKNGIYILSASSDSKAFVLSVEKDSEEFYYSPFYRRIDFSLQNETSVEAVLYSVEKQAKLLNEKLDEEKESNFSQNIEEKVVVQETTQEALEEHKTDLSDLEDESEEQKEFLPKWYDFNDKLEDNSKTFLVGNSVKKVDGAFTFLCKDREKRAISGVKIYLGTPKIKALFPVCTSNKQGRCVFTKNFEFTNAFVVAKKHGYISAAANIDIRNQKRRILYLEKGIGLDILTLTESYGTTRAISGVEVRIDENLLGKTNEYGYFGHKFTGRKDDLVIVKLIPKNFTPEIFETNYIAQESMELVKYFTNRDGNLPKAVVFPISVLQSSDDAEKMLFADIKMQKIFEVFSSALKNSLNQGWYEDFPLQNLSQKMIERKENANDLLTKSWSNTLWSQYFQFIIVPTIVKQAESWGIELRMIDQNGVVVTAAFVGLGKDLTGEELFRAIPKLSAKLRSKFPFEGTIVEKNGDVVKVAFAKHIPQLDPLREMRIFGMQIRKSGGGKNYAEVGKAKLSEQKSEVILAKINTAAVRSVLEKGDKVILSSQINDNLEINLTSSTNETPEKVRIYKEDEFLGNARINSAYEKEGEYLVLSEGFAPLNYDKKKHILQAGSRNLWLGTKPQGAKIYLNKTFIGISPLITFVPFKQNELDLGILSPSGYRSVNYLLPVEGNFLDYQWGSTIVLNPDFITAASNFITAKRYKKAKDLLIKIEKNSPDYFLAQHLLAKCFAQEEDSLLEALKVYKNIPFQDLFAKDERRFYGPYFNFLVLSWRLGNIEDFPFIYGELENLKDKRNYFAESDAAFSVLDISYLEFEIAKTLYLKEHSAEWLKKLNDNYTEFNKNFEVMEVDKDKFYPTLRRNMQRFIFEQRAS